MIARNGIHYNNPPGLDRPFFTLQGRAELSSWQRGMIEQAFYDHTLGDTYEFPEYTEVCDDFQSEEEDSGIKAAGDCAEYTGEDYALADRIYDEGRDDACLGHDTPGARMYNEARDKVRGLK